MIAGLILIVCGVVGMCRERQKARAVVTAQDGRLLASTQAQLTNEEGLGSMRLAPPSFPPPKLAVRTFPATREFIRERLDMMLAAPAEDFAGNVPRSVADLSQAVLGHVEDHAELDSWLKLTARIGECVPPGVRGAVLVDFLYDDGEPSGITLEASTLPEGGDGALKACMGKAFALSIPRAIGTAVVPSVIQFPIKNSHFYAYLEGLR